MRGSFNCFTLHANTSFQNTGSYSFMTNKSLDQVSWGATLALQSQFLSLVTLKGPLSTNMMIRDLLEIMLVFIVRGEFPS